MKSHRKSLILQHCELIFLFREFDVGTLNLGKVKLFEHPNDWDTCTPPLDAVPGLMVQLERSKLIDNKRGHSNTELYSAFLGAFDEFPWKTSNQLSGPMIPAIKDIQNLKSAHLIGKPEFGAVIESDVRIHQKCIYEL